MNAVLFINERTGDDLGRFILPTVPNVGDVMIGLRIATAAVTRRIYDLNSKVWTCYVGDR